MCEDGETEQNLLPIKNPNEKKGTVGTRAYMGGLQQKYDMVQRE